MRKIHVFLGVIYIILLGGCGQSGPLYLPERVENPPTKTTQTAVPMGVTSQNQTILSEQPYTDNSAEYKLPMGSDL